METILVAFFGVIQLFDDINLTFIEILEMIGDWLLMHTKTGPKFPLAAVTVYFIFTTAAWAAFMMEVQNQRKNWEKLHN